MLYAIVLEAAGGIEDVLKEKAGVRRESRNPNPFAALFNAAFNMMILSTEVAMFLAFLSFFICDLRSLKRVHYNYIINKSG